MTLWLVCLGSLAAALLAAVALASRDRSHVPVVAVLGVGLLADFVMGHREAWGLNWLLVPPHHTLRPLYYLSNALVTSWPAALAALAWGAFPGKRADLLPAPGKVASSRKSCQRPWLAAPLVWALANAALIAVDPDRAGAQRALLAAELAALVAGAAAARAGWSRAWGHPERAAVWLLGVELVVVTLGPFRSDIYARWDLARLAYTLGFAVLAGLQVAAWHRLRPRRQDPTVDV